ncbi:NifB/NifX family molybdenum-iron cluster-binding protein [Vallitalea maricola]|uniref:NifB/NifX family molybdenum-iron cluster-binding protein n=1 Tax=Vallitalea maricola TaxID=3074433 RepID=A0ACB5UPD5_9FIRM|nr:NifB/NifX family molybdenum-iron cluster-binding protein [Vallitalea sp. AN17-2]
MKVAIAKEGNVVSGHFGYCEGFQIYEVENNQVKDTTLVANPGHKPGFLPRFLGEKNVNVIIAGGMGATAQQLFNENNISVIVGASGELDEVIKRYLDGKLESTGSVCHDHSHHDEGCED